MSDDEFEKLAIELWQAYDEVWPDGSILTWDDLGRGQQAAWMSVAKFVTEQNLPQVVVFNNAKFTEYDRKQIEEQIRSYKNPLSQV